MTEATQTSARSIMQYRVPARLPKAEMHVHISLALSNELFGRRVNEDRTPFPHLTDRKDNRYYSDLTTFHATYEGMRGLTVTLEELEEVTRTYLERIAAEGAIYAELSNTFRDTERFCGQVEAIGRGIDAAREGTGIEARIVATAIRNYDHKGPKQAEMAAKFLAQHPMKYVTGFGLVGDEGEDSLAKYKKALRIAFNDAGLGLTPHVGEQHVTNAVDFLGIIPAGALRIDPERDDRRLRVGHGTMTHVSGQLMEEFRRRGVCLEVCLSANKRLQLPKKARDRALNSHVWASDNSRRVKVDLPLLNYYREMGQHPLSRFFEYQMACCLGSDNPLLMNTNIGKEYSLAVQAAGCDDAQLLGFTRNAIEHANVDHETRERLRSKLNHYDAMAAIGDLPGDTVPALQYLVG